MKKIKLNNNIFKIYFNFIYFFLIIIINKKYMIHIKRINNNLLFNK